MAALFIKPLEGNYVSNDTWKDWVKSIERI